MIDIADTAKSIQNTDFDSVFYIEDGKVIVDRNLYAPSVYNDPDGDVNVDSSDWECLTGMTGQYSYNGAVMHPSEYVGIGIARRLTDQDEFEPGTRFAIVTVNDLDDDDDDNIIGWAIAYRKEN